MPTRPSPRQVIAHRGASAQQKENTVAAFAEAARIGAHAVELDVRRTADGALVVHHDAHLPDGRAIVEVAAADLPEWLPTFSAALDACEGMWVNVEIKNDPADPDFDDTRSVARPVLEELDRRGAPERWLISSFDMGMIDACRALVPEIRTAFLCLEPRDGIVDTLVTRGHAALHPWWPCATEDLVAACHAAGVQVNVWTANDPDDIARLWEAGVDGVCTDVPDVALRVLGALD